MDVPLTAGEICTGAAVFTDPGMMPAAAVGAAQRREVRQAP